jgi:hypothetical protein
LWQQVESENEPKEFMQIVQNLISDIEEEQQQLEDADREVMCVRGLLMLLKIEHLS